MVNFKEMLVIEYQRLRLYAALYRAYGLHRSCDERPFLFSFAQAELGFIL